MSVWERNSTVSSTIVGSGQNVIGVPAVVGDATAAVSEQRDVDLRCLARHRFVDRVVDDLVDEVVQTGDPGGPDVHTRAFPDRLETLQNRDVFGLVRHRAQPLRDWRKGPGKSAPRCGGNSEPNDRGNFRK